jgi:fused signal recognition particle receptor
VKANKNAERGKMFDILKKKISSFVDDIATKIKGEEKEKKEPRELPEAAKVEEKKAPVEPIEETKTTPEKLKSKPQRSEQKAKGPREPAIPFAPARMPETKKLEAKPQILTQIKSLISSDVTIKEEDVRSVIDDFELQLLTADVAVPVVEELILDLKRNIVGKRIEYKSLNAFINQSIASALADVMAQERFDIVSFAKGMQKPVKILFIGPNGAGKTTTIAKLANLLKKNGFSPVLAASDTFRAAAIEQTAEHASRIGIPVIRHQYGSDPSAVAFDAIKYAETHAADVVLIDTAGRQETNRNLIEQLKKITRVVKPDLKIFVGEGIAGNAIVSQVREFNEAIGLDGVILTKIDVDTKGGTVISIKKATGVPILYIGIGQGYDDFIPFDPSFVTSKLMS